MRTRLPLWYANLRVCNVIDMPVNLLLLQLQNHVRSRRSAMHLQYYQSMPISANPKITYEVSEDPCSPSFAMVHSAYYAPSAKFFKMYR